MWLHIRGVGQWTNRLYEYFEKEQEKLHNGEIPAQSCARKRRPSNGSIQTNNNQNPIKKLQATITRTFSNREADRKPVQLVGFNQNNHADLGAKTSVSESDLNSAEACSSNSTGK